MHHTVYNLDDPNRLRDPMGIGPQKYPAGELHQVKNTQRPLPLSDQMAASPAPSPNDAYHYPFRPHTVYNLDDPRGIGAGTNPLGESH
jgi:hypothetical protein